jgi:DNA-binding beta-propeller fold protein YncE
MEKLIKSRAIKRVKEASMFTLLTRRSYRFSVPIRLFAGLLVGVVVSLLAFASTPPASTPPFPEQMKYPNIVPPKRQFGRYGSKPGELNEPLGVAISNDKEIFIADTYNNRINVYDSEGNFRRSWGKLGSGPADLKLPQGVAVSSGRVFVSDTGNNRIQVFNTSGHAIAQWGLPGAGPGQLNTPLGLAADSRRVYVADTGNERVEVFTREGKFLFTIGGFGTRPGEFDRPTDVAVDPNGYFYVTDSYNNRIQKFDPQGNPSHQWGEWGSYSGLMANPSGVSYAKGRLYVSDLINHRIQVFDPGGNYLFQWGRHPIVGHEGNGRLHYPHKIAVAPSGKFSVVCEPFEYRCQIFDSNVPPSVVSQVDDTAWWDKKGRFHYGTTIIIIKPSGPVISAGKFPCPPIASIIAIAEPDTHSVLTFLTRGDKPQFLTRLGGQGRTLGSFVRPSGIAYDADSDRIIVSDGGNHRLEIFELAKVDPCPDSYAPNASRVVSARSVIGIGLDKISGQGFDGSQKSPVEPGSLVRGKDGLLYMADPHNSRVVALDRNLNFVRSIGRRGNGDGELLVPTSISFSRDGEILFVVDTYNFRIVAFRRNGEYLFHWGQAGIRDREFIHPFGITSGVDGFVYVTDDAANRVQKFDERGQHVKTWGRWGTEPGQFYKPKGIAQDERGQLIVADFGNHRAQIMSPDGLYIDMFGIGEGYTPPLSISGGAASLARGSGGDISNGATYVVTYTVDGGQIHLNKPFNMRVHVLQTRSKTPAESVELRVSATMPAHFHGMTTEPRITQEEKGTWRVDGMLLHMPGAWQISFDIYTNGMTERAESDVMLQPK